VANLVGVSGCPREGTNFCPGRGYGHCSRLPAVEMGGNMKKVTLSEWDIVFRSATTKRGSPSVAALKERHGKLTKSYDVSNVREAITRVMAKDITPAHAVRSHTRSGCDATYFVHYRIDVVGVNSGLDEVSSAIFRDTMLPLVWLWIQQVET